MKPELKPRVLPVPAPPSREVPPPPRLVVLEAENQALRAKLVELHAALERQKSDATRSREAELESLRKQAERIRWAELETRQAAKRALEDAALRAHRAEAALVAEHSRWEGRRARFAREVEGLRSVHPLRDLLAYTEREIARVEADLARAGMDRRADLEAARAELLAQRTYLGHAIREAEDRVERLARELREAKE